MLRARLMIAWTLLMAACALTVGVSLAVVAQEPKKPDQPAVEPQQPDQWAFQRPIVERLEKLIKAKPVVNASADNELRKLLIARYEVAVRILEANLVTSNKAG